MTIKIKVEHCEKINTKPIEVYLQNPANPLPSKYVVQPGESVELYVHSHQSLLVVESQE